MMLRIVILLCLLLGGCRLPPDAAQHPEIDFWDGVFFIGDPRDGSVQAVSVRNSPVIVARSFVAERKAVLRVRVEPALGQLWVWDANAIYVHDLKTLELRQRTPLALGIAPDRRNDPRAHVGLHGAYDLPMRHHATRKGRD
jgi:hypothetical protein